MGGTSTSAAVQPNERTKLLSVATTKNPLLPLAHARVNTAGLLVLAALIWSWVLQAEAAQMLQTGMSFNKPFFVVGFNHTVMTLLLPGLFVYHKLRERHTNALATATSTSTSTVPQWFDVIATLERHCVLPTRQLVRVAAFLSAFYCVADYFWYKALATVSVAAGTAIFNCSPLFVYCFSICFLRERATLQKLLGVATAFVGVTLILMFQDTSGGGGSGERLHLSAVAHLESASFVAGLLMVLSAACYGGYEVAFQVAVGDDITDTSTLLTLTGLSGLFTIPYWLLGSVVLAACPLPALHEPLGWPATTEALAALVTSGCFGFVFNVFLPLSICWTSPLETSVGCMFTIPLSGLVDALFHRTRFSLECVAGTLLVLAGFGVLEYASSSKPAETRTVKPDASALA